MNISTFFWGEGGGGGWRTWLRIIRDSWNVWLVVANNQTTKQKCVPLPLCTLGAGETPIRVTHMRKRQCRENQVREKVSTNEASRRGASESSFSSSNRSRSFAARVCDPKVGLLAGWPLPLQPSSFAQRCITCDQAFFFLNTYPSLQVQVCDSQEALRLLRCFCFPRPKKKQILQFLSTLSPWNVSTRPKLF